MNVGRTFGRAIVFGGLPLLLGGASRTAGTPTVTYHREAPPAPVVEVIARGSDTGAAVEGLQHLAELRAAGHLTEEQFAAMKSRLIELGPVEPGASHI